MSQVEIDYNTGADKTFERNFYRMFLKGILVDTTIVCGTHTVRAHKIVLAANSKFFENAIKASDPSEPVIVIKDLDVDILKALIEFMYIGKTKIHETKLPAFKYAANRLGVVAIKNACMAFKNPDEEEAPVEAPVLEGPCDLAKFEGNPDVPFIIDTISHPIEGSVDKIIADYMAKCKMSSNPADDKKPEN